MHPISMLIITSSPNRDLLRVTLLQGQALVFNAAAEVGVGFFLLLALLTPQRSILLSFVYWKNFLPARYHTPDAAGYHRQVRARQSLSPLLSISCPLPAFITGRVSLPACATLPSRKLQGSRKDAW